MTKFIKRLGRSVMAILLAIDILLCAVWLGVLYPFGLSGMPTGRQFISTYVGLASHNGHRWARIVEWVIDTLFVALGDKPHHCYRMYVAYDSIDD